MRGVGQTAMMIANLPLDQCTIVAPTGAIGRAIAARVKTANPGPRRYITIRHHSDVQKLMGLSEPIFFDHSFFDMVDADTARAALDLAIPASLHRIWGGGHDRP